MEEYKNMGDNSWSTYEANLQAYRSNFLSSQSIMLAVGAIIIDKSKIATVLIAAIAVFQIVYVWLPVIYYRFLLVDFHKYCLGDRFDVNGDFVEKENGEPLTELIYCKNKKIRQKVNEYLSKEISRERPFGNWRETRRKIDIVIPVSMISLWCIYILVACGII